MSQKISYSEKISVKFPQVTNYVVSVIIGWLYNKRRWKLKRKLLNQRREKFTMGLAEICSYTGCWVSAS